jgi:adenylosuccinate lyase
MENVALWHERDISHSSVERVIFPDSCILTDYALQRITKILDKLNVYPENMLVNLRLTRGLIFSQALLLKLVEKGMLREDAYKIIQDESMACWHDGTNFKNKIRRNSAVTNLLTPKEINSCFNEKIGLKHVDYIYQKVGIL